MYEPVIAGAHNSDYLYRVLCNIYQVTLSMILKWYKVDFGTTNAEVSWNKKKHRALSIHLL